MKPYLSNIKYQFEKSFLASHLPYQVSFNALQRLKPYYRHIHKPSIENYNFDTFHTIYIDVSIYAKSDSNTGIQRVIREVIRVLLQDEFIRHRLTFVIATKKLGYRVVPLNIVDNQLNFETKGIDKTTATISPTHQDAFIGLDFCPSIIPAHLSTLLKWKIKGVTMAWVIYDLLPVSNPEWFTPAIQENFQPWLKAILLLADVNLCISNTVRQATLDFSHILQIEPQLATIRLGQGFSITNLTATTNATTKMPLLPKDYILLVGTLEPRKGHLSIIEAFEKLWQQNSDTPALVLVGKQGWLVDDLVEKIHQHLQYKKRLFWLSQTSDRQLDLLYQSTLGVVVASYNEGFGLPLMEALTYNKPAFVRDIPIFQEVVDNNPLVTFFDDEKSPLESELNKWLMKLLDRPVESPSKFTSKQFENWGWNNTLEDIKTALH